MMASTIVDNATVFQNGKCFESCECCDSSRPNNPVHFDDVNCPSKKSVAHFVSDVHDTRQELSGVAEISTENRDSGKFLVSYRNRVYDIWDFLGHHPGGRKLLSQHKNRSVDKAFNEIPHSKSAFYLFEEFVLDEQGTKEKDFVDWKAPIVEQVGALKDRYWEWVNLPVNRPVRLFQSDILEQLSITPWYLIPIVWLPLCFYFLYNGYLAVTPGRTAGGEIYFKASSSYILGLLIWTILEYVLHRKLFHFKPPETSKLLITVHFLIHGVHHKAPFDDRRLLFPPLLGTLVAKVIYDIYKVIFPQPMLYFIAAGTTTGYICYDLMHYYLHYGAPKFGSYFYTMKRNHNYHHFLHHNQGFGISSTLWDRAFQTKVRLRRLAKPIEW